MVHRDLLCILLMVHQALHDPTLRVGSQAASRSMLAAQTTSQHSEGHPYPISGVPAGPFRLVTSTPWKVSRVRMVAVLPLVVPAAL